MPVEFVHLGGRSDYSVGQSLASPDQLVRAAASWGQRTMALADAGTLAGAVEFAASARRLGVRPVFGIELQVRCGGECGGMRLLAENRAGWCQLVALSSRSTAGQDRLVVDADDLLHGREGLIALASPDSAVSRAALAGDFERAEHAMTRLIEAFGKRRVALVLVPPVDEDARRRCNLLRKVARYFGLRTVAVPEIRCARPEDDLAWCLLDGLHDAERPTRFGDLARERTLRCHPMPGDEVAELYADFPEALAATVEIAAMCQVELPHPPRRFPRHEFMRGVDADSFVWNKCFERAAERYGEGGTVRWHERLNREFEELSRLGLADALVTLALLDEALDQQEVPRGPGAGFLTNSLVASLLGLTRIDPLRFDLPFLPPADSAERTPVLELAIPSSHQKSAERVLEELFQKSLCRAGKWQRRSAGAAAEVVADLLHLDVRKIRRVTNSAAWHRAREEDTLGPAGQDPDHDLALSDVRSVAWLARRYEGRVRTMRATAGEFLLVAAEREAPLPRLTTSEEELCSQWESEAATGLGFARIRFVSRPLLDLMTEAAGWIREQGSRHYDPTLIGAEDRGAAQTVGSGMTQGIASLEPPQLRRALRRSAPRTLAELSRICAEHSGRTDARFESTLLAWTCAAMKASEPAAFLAAALSEFSADPGMVAALLADARRSKIDILAIDLNCSAERWAPDRSGGGPGLRPGLILIGGMTRAAIRELLTVRREMTYSSLADLLRRTHPRLLKASHAELLIRAGALDSFQFSRQDLLAQLEELTPLLRPSGRKAAADDPLEFLGQDGTWWLNNQVSLEVFESSEEEDSLEWIAEQERKTMRHTISLDPLYFEEEWLEDAHVVPASRIAPKMEGEICIVGFIGSLEEIDEGGAPMVLAEVEGCLVEAKPVQAAFLERRLKTGQPVLAAGRLEREGDVRVLRAEILESPEEAARRALKAECVEIDIPRLDNDELKALHALLKRYSGSTPVRLTGVPVESKRIHNKLQSRRVILCPGLELGLNRIAGTKCWRAYVASGRATPSGASNPGIHRSLV